MDRGCFELKLTEFRFAARGLKIMANIDRWFLRIAVLYALVAMVLGIAMGISQDHSQMPTHAHLNLVGWVSMALYALVYRQYPAAGQSRLALAHFWIANVGAVLLNLGVYGLMADITALEPVAIAGSLVTILGMLTFAGIVYQKV
jgi:cbb3-type cytochrome oxidase subunit 1